jgi:hypothetical protein
MKKASKKIKKLERKLDSINEVMKTLATIQPSKLGDYQTKRVIVLAYLAIDKIIKED